MVKDKSFNTQKIVSQSLKNLRKHVDLMNPDAVRLYICDAKNEKTKKDLDNDTKRKLAEAYDKFVIANGLKWNKPRFKTTEITPLIPTTDYVTKIISASTEMMS